MHALGAAWLESTVTVPPRQPGNAPARSMRAHSYRRSCVAAAAEDRGGEQPALISRSSRRQALLLGTCALCAQQLPARANEWSYSDVDAWSRVSATCGLGERQSPVDLGTGSPAVGSSGIRLNYAGQWAACVRDSGHGTMQVDFGDDAPVLSVGKQTFRLAQFHFHSPSEHAIAGKRVAMEAHLVHKEVSTGALAVMATLLSECQNAAPNAALAAALLNAPPAGSHEGEAQAAASVVIPGGVDASALLPRRDGGGIFTYSGSLTTPPCAEQVTWYVNDAGLDVPPQQVLAFRKAYGMAAPPPADDESPHPSGVGYWLAETVRRPEACLQAVAGCFRSPGVVDVVVNHERWLELVEPAPTEAHRSVSWTPLLGAFPSLAVCPWNARRGVNAAETHELFGLDLLVGVTGLTRSAHNADEGVVCVLAWHHATLRFKAKQRFHATNVRRRPSLWRVSVDPSGTAVGVECNGQAVMLFTTNGGHNLEAPIWTEQLSDVSCVVWCSATMALDEHLHMLTVAFDGMDVQFIGYAGPCSPGSSGAHTSAAHLDSRGAPPVGLLPCPHSSVSRSGCALVLCVNAIHVLRVSLAGLATTCRVDVRRSSNSSGGKQDEVVPTSWTWVNAAHPVLLLGVCCKLESWVEAFTLDPGTGVLAPCAAPCWPLAHDCVALCVSPACGSVLVFGSGGACTTISLGNIDTWAATQRGVAATQSEPATLQLQLSAWRAISAPCLAVDVVPGCTDTVRLLCGPGCGDGDSVLRTCTLAAPVTQRSLGPSSRDMRSLTGMWVIPPAAHRVATLGGGGSASILVLSFVEATRLMRLDAGHWTDVTDSTTCAADTRSIAAGVASGELVQVCASGVLVLGPRLAAPSTQPLWAWLPPPGESISVAQVSGDMVAVSTSRTWQLHVLRIAPHQDGPHAGPGLRVVATTALPSEPSCMHITPAGQLASAFVGSSGEEHHGEALLAVGTYQPGLVLLALSASNSSLTLVSSLAISGGGESAIPHAVVVTCAGYTPQGAPHRPCVFVSLRDGRLVRVGHSASTDIMERDVGSVPASLISMDTHSLMVFSDVPWVLTPVDGAQCFDMVQCVSPFLAFAASAAVVLPWADAAPLLGGAAPTAEATPVLVCDGDTLRLLVVHAPGVQVDDVMAVHGRPCAALAAHACEFHADGQFAGHRSCESPLALIGVTDQRSSDTASPRSELFAVDVQSQKAMLDGIRLHSGERFSCISTWYCLFEEPGRHASDPQTVLAQLVLVGTSREPSAGAGLAEGHGRLLVMRLRFNYDPADGMGGEAGRARVGASCKKEGGGEWPFGLGDAQWEILAEARLPGAVTAVAGCDWHMRGQRVAVACGQAVYVLRLVPPWQQSPGAEPGDDTASPWALVKLSGLQRPVQLRGTVTGLCWLLDSKLCVSDDWDGVNCLHFASEAAARPTVVVPRHSRQRSPPPAEPFRRDAHPRVTHLDGMETPPGNYSTSVCAVTTDGIAHIYTPSETGVDRNTAAEVRLERTAAFGLDGVASCVKTAWSAFCGDVVYIGTALGGLVRLRRVERLTFSELAALEERLAEHEVTMPVCTRPPSTPTELSQPPGLKWQRTVRGGSVAERRVLDGDLLREFVSLPAALQAEVALTPGLATPSLDVQRMHRCLAALARLQQPVGTLNAEKGRWPPFAWFRPEAL